MRGEIIKVQIDCRGVHCGDCHLRDGQVCRAFGSILTGDYEDNIFRCFTCQNTEVEPEENALNKMLIADLTRDVNEENTRAEKAEAELERTRPLVEAVMAADKEWLEPQLNCPCAHCSSNRAVLRAAYALREKEKP